MENRKKTFINFFEGSAKYSVTGTIGSFSSNAKAGFLSRLLITCQKNYDFSSYEKQVNIHYYIR